MLPRYVAVYNRRLNEARAALERADGIEVAQSGLDAREHYLNFGYREGRQPNALFIPDRYLDLSPDVAAAGLDPLTHYEQFGIDEGRSTGLIFIDNYYEDRPDVAAAGINPYKHFIEFGYYELLANA